MRLLGIVSFLTFTGIRSCVFPPTSPWSFTFWVSFTRMSDFYVMKWVSCNNRAITISPPSVPPFADDPPAASCFGLRQLMNTYKKKRSTHGEDEGKLILQKDRYGSAMRSGGSKSSISPGPSQWWVAGRQPAWWTSQLQVIKLVLQGFHHRWIPALWNSKSW